MTNKVVYDEQGHLHFVTFSCFKRRRYLQTDRAKRIVIGNLGSWLSKQNGICLGFVVMPDHVHALLWFQETNQLSLFMNKWKDRSSHFLKELMQSQYPGYWSQVKDTDPIWQSRFYDFNVWSAQKVEEKIDYMHQNPVRAELAAHAIDWPWSSARWYLQGKSVGLPISWPPGLGTDTD